MEKKTNMYIFLSMRLLQISSNSHPNQSTRTHTFVCVYIYTKREDWNTQTLATYSISANLKAMPRHPKRTETSEQAAENCASWRSRDPDLIVLASSSNALATTESGVPSSFIEDDCLRSCWCCCGEATSRSWFEFSRFLKDLACIYICIYSLLWVWRDWYGEN